MEPQAQTVKLRLVNHLLAYVVTQLVDVRLCPIRKYCSNVQVHGHVDFDPAKNRLAERIYNRCCKFYTLPSIFQTGNVI